MQILKNWTKQRDRGSLQLLQVVLWMFVMLLGGGCVAQGAFGSSKPVPVRQVTAAEFRLTSSTSESMADVRPAEDPPSAVRVMQSHDSIRLVATDEHFDPAPFLAAQQPQRSTKGEPVYVDRMVGQVNGRPIFANAFFIPIDDQLRALSQRSAQRQFAEQAYEIIYRHLDQVVTDQLFLAEAESGLTTEQQAGLLYWLSEVEKRMILEKEGSRTQAEQEILESEGKTLPAYLDEKRREVLIAEVYRKNVLPRVIVSWRDIQRAYERQYKRFNPDTRMTVSRIMLRTATEQTLIDQVKSKLAAGEAFGDVAEFAGRPDGGHWTTFTLDDRGIAGLALEELLVRQLKELGVGETSDAFEFGALTLWLHVDSIEQPPSASLYDSQVQRAIINELRSRRTLNEQQRFVEALKERGIHDDLRVMAARLLDMAIVRHGRP